MSAILHQYIVLPFFQDFRAGGFLRAAVSRRRTDAQKIITSDHRGFAGVQPPATQPPPASICSPELSYPAQASSSVNTRLVGAGDHLRAAVFPPEDNIPKDYYLRPPRLRRSTAARHAASSGKHLLSGVELSAAVFSSEEPPAHRNSISTPFQKITLY